MAKRMLIDATHPEETRVVVINNNLLEDLDFEISSRRPVKGNIYLAKVMRVEPSLQAAFVEYGGNRHGFLAFSEIHPDYYRIPNTERQDLDTDGSRPTDGVIGSLDGMGGSPSTVPLNYRSVGEDPYPIHEPLHSLIEDVPPVLEQPTQAAYPLEFSVPALRLVPPGPGAPDIQPGGVGESASEESRPLHEPVRSFVEDMTPVSTLPVPVAYPLDFSETQLRSDPDLRDVLPSGAGELADTDSELEPLGGDEIEEIGARWSRSGHERNYKIHEVIKRRQIVLIQVTKEERGTKGAALTTHLSLPGRYCVLMPNTPRGGGVSRKITNQQDRKRLKEILEDLDVPVGMSVILRTAGMERSKLEIKRDLDYLLRLWNQIREKAFQSVAPELVYEEGNLIKRSIRDVYGDGIEDIIVEGDEGYRLAKDFMKMLMPSHSRHIKQYKDNYVPLFMRYQIEGQIDAIHNPVVQLKSGGYIVLNQTEALVSIDVNSGRATRERNIEETATATNLEASDEIARQLRLRDLAGLIVIDFIDMEDGRNNTAVERRLKDAMRIDRARIQIGSISPFGLMELSRQRLRPSLVETHFVRCIHCQGLGIQRSTESAAMEAMRAVQEEGIRRRSAEVSLTVPTSVALYLLNQMRSALVALEARYDMRVLVTADAQMLVPACRVDRLKARLADGPSTSSPQLPSATRPAFASYGAVDQPPDATAVPKATDEAVTEDPGDLTKAQNLNSTEEDEELGRPRRRRRRRRGRAGGAETGSGEQQTRRPTTFAVLSTPVGSDTEGDDEDAEGEDEGESLELEAVPPGGTRTNDSEGGGDDEPRRRRRRGRRGGRRRREPPFDGTVNAEEDTAWALPEVVDDSLIAPSLPVDVPPLRPVLAAVMPLTPLTQPVEPAMAEDLLDLSGLDLPPGMPANPIPLGDLAPVGDHLPLVAGGEETATQPILKEIEHQPSADTRPIRALDIGAADATPEVAGTKGTNGDTTETAVDISATTPPARRRRTTRPKADTPEEKAEDTPSKALRGRPRRTKAAVVAASGNNGEDLSTTSDQQTSPAAAPLAAVMPSTSSPALSEPAGPGAADTNGSAGRSAADIPVVTSSSDPERPRRGWWKSRP